MNRIDRLTAIIIFLQGRKFVTIESLSERYGISERTVYRDLSALQEAGVPIGSEPGRGYFIVKGYHLPPVMFDRNEAAALLAGERLMQRWSQTELGKSYLSALDKIRAILPPDEKEFFEVLDERIQTVHYQNKNETYPSSDERIFAFLQNAIFKKEIIEITYLSPYKQSKTNRIAEPLGLLLMSNHWYLAAWCRMREDYRMFRLDRFENFKPTGIVMRQPTGHTLQDFYNRNLYKEENLTEVVIWFEREYAHYVGEQKYWHGWAWERSIDDGIEMTFLSSSIDYLSRWLLTWGNKIVVRKPELVKNRIKKLIGELDQHHT